MSKGCLRRFFPSAEVFGTFCVKKYSKNDKRKIQDNRLRVSNRCNTRAIDLLYNPQGEHTSSPLRSLSSREGIKMCGRDPSALHFVGMTSTRYGPGRADPAPTNNSLPALPYSLFEKRESPGNRLRWRSLLQQRANELFERCKRLVKSNPSLKAKRHR